MTSRLPAPHLLRLLEDGDKSPMGLGNKLYEDHLDQGGEGPSRRRPPTSPLNPWVCCPRACPRIGRGTRLFVIREEFVALTGSPLIAAILNQLLYWSQRVSDFDLFWNEETFSSPQGIPKFQYGWFYKKAQDLIEETMINVTPATLRRYLAFLIERGWIQTRTNPQYTWDRRTQYRVKLRKLCADLQKKGHRLQGFETYETLFHSQKDICEKEELSTACLTSKTENASLKERLL